MVLHKYRWLAAGEIESPHMIALTKQRQKQAKSPSWVLSPDYDAARRVTIWRNPCGCAAGNRHPCSLEPRTFRAIPDLH